MIVICTGCQAKFRVADEKIGPRGARVRCSKCRTMFLVRRDAAAATPAPAVELDLTPGPRQPAPAPGGAAVIPFPGAASQPQPPAPDPFAAAGLDPFGEPGPVPADDPFAHLAGLARAAQAPAGLSGPGEPSTVSREPTPSPDDPFARLAEEPAPEPAAPFGGLSTGTTGAQRLPVTDLSQLLDPATPAAAPVPPPFAPAAPEAAFGADPQDVFAAVPQDVFAAVPQDVFATEPQAAPEPQLGPDPGFEVDVPPELGPEPRLGVEPPPVVGPPLGMAAPSGAPGADLSLEEHSGEQRAAVVGPNGVMMQAEPGALAFGGAAFEPGSAGPLYGPEESLALATDPTPGPPRPEGDPVVPLAGEPPPLARGAPEAAAPDGAEAVDPEEDDLRQAGLSGPGASSVHRLRSAAVNALALVALLAAALAFRVVLRGDVSLGPAALRPSTLLRALHGSAPARGTFEVAGARTGVYAQSAGGTVLFVRGEVVSRAPGPVRAVRVEAELVRDGQVLARGEARAGAVPTPEEVDRATDRAALDALAAALRGRAPRTIAPGDRLAFLVTLGDAPPDVSGTSIRVRAERDDAGD